MLVLILLAVGGAAAAASFTHVHDWTMANSPAGTGDWFGWANAIISDLVPLGVGLEVRRRRRHSLKIGAYPIVVILCAAALSLAGQLAEAKSSVTGWLLAAVPALGFLALTKLVLSRPTVSSSGSASCSGRRRRPPGFSRAWIRGVGGATSEGDAAFRTTCAPSATGTRRA
jgi:hypothetical protein